jgi:recombination protein U
MGICYNGRKGEKTMVNYPNKKKQPVNQNWPVHEEKKLYTAYRGMNLEEDLNESNRAYLEQDIAVIYKEPTPIQIVKFDYPRRAAATIVEAYYQKPSTTDYNGLYRGHYIDFEAKETKVDYFPFKNISEHQILHLERVLKHGGIAFLMLAFTSREEVYLIDASYVTASYRKDEKKITYVQAQTYGHLVRQGFAPRLHYLEILDEYYFKD